MLRPHDGQTPPTAEEQPAECSDGGHEYEKVIHAPKVSFGAGWSPYGVGGGKGRWRVAEMGTDLPSSQRSLRSLSPFGRGGQW